MAEATPRTAGKPADPIRSAGERGAAGMEFVVIGTLFLMLFFGIIVYGIYFFSLIGITNAASEAARAAVAGLSASERIALAQAQATRVLAAYGPIISAANATVTAGASPTNSNDFQVTIAYNFASLGLSGLSVVPIPNSSPSITVTVGNGN